jgi:dolichol-phosphate mannosyltransferase
LNSSTKSLYVLVPVYNESKNVGSLINDLIGFENSVRPEYVLKTVFVDDGSSDNTADVILKLSKENDVTLIRHELNQGPGGAFASGFAYLSSVLKDVDWVVTMEGDNTSRLDTLKRMLTRKNEGYDVVLASPYTYGGGFSKVSFVRFFISHAANGMLKLFLGLRGINTFSSFFRLYSGKIILNLQHDYGEKIVYSQGFESMVELLVKLVEIKASISEVEMRVDWELRKGKSKMKIAKTILGYLLLICKLKIGKLGKMKGL